MLRTPRLRNTALLTIYKERVKGIEPSSSAWKAEVLPLNYTRKEDKSYTNRKFPCFQPLFDKNCAFF